MPKYPKPAGYNGGPDGSIVRQGTGGRLGINPYDDDIDPELQSDFDVRRQVLSFEHADLGGDDSPGMCEY